MSSPCRLLITFAAQRRQGLPPRSNTQCCVPRGSSPVWAAGAGSALASSCRAKITTASGPTLGVHGDTPSKKQISVWYRFPVPISRELVKFKPTCENPKHDGLRNAPCNQQGRQRATTPSEPIARNPQAAGRCVGCHSPETAHRFHEPGASNLGLAKRATPCSGRASDPHTGSSSILCISLQWFAWSSV
jgi:hypothetical protein